MTTFTNQRLKEAIGTLSAQHLGLPPNTTGNPIPDTKPLIVEVKKVHPTSRSIEFCFKNSPTDNRYIAHANVDHWYREGKDTKKHEGEGIISFLLMLLSMLGIPGVGLLGAPLLKSLPLLTKNLPSLLSLIQIPHINTATDVIEHIDPQNKHQIPSVNNFEELLQIPGIDKVLENSGAVKPVTSLDSSVLDLNTLLHLLSMLGIPGVGAISHLSSFINKLSQGSKKSNWPFGVPENTTNQLNTILPLINMIVPGASTITTLPSILNTVPRVLTSFASPFQILDTKINISTTLNILSIIGVPGAPKIEDIPLITRNLPHLLEIVKIPGVNSAEDVITLIGKENVPGFQKIPSFNELIKVPGLESILNQSGIKDLPNTSTKHDEEFIKPKEPLYATVTPINGNKENGYLFLGFIKLEN
jgi:hypothetical protein